MVPPLPLTEPEPFAARLAFLYAALFLVVGIYMPYMPVWLHWRGLDENAIAVLLAAPLFVRIVSTPLISFAADHSSDRRSILIGLGAATVLSLLLLWGASGFWQMLAAAVLLAISWTTIMPLIETIAVAGIRRSGLDYGKVRLWGSASFILASFGGGLLIEGEGPWSIMPMLLAAAAAMLLGCSLIPRALTARRLPEAVVYRPPKLADALALAHSKQFLLFLFVASAVQASHAVYYAFGTINWRAQGISTELIGALWAFGVVAEIGLFAVSGRLVARLGAGRLLLLACVAGVVRWTLMAIDPPFWLTVIAQSLHALTFGAAHIAAIYFLTHAVPEDRAATAQGIYAAVVAGLALGFATIASGPLYRTFGAYAYAAMAVLALIAAFGAGLLLRRWQGEYVVDPLELQPQSSAVIGSSFPDL